MNGRSLDSWEQIVRETAVSFPYPPTPDVAGAVRRRRLAPKRRVFLTRRRLAWALALALLLVGGLMAVPQVRAAVLEMLRIGALRIFIAEPTPTPETAVGAAAPVTATPPALNAALSSLAGATTLAEAAAQAPFPILAPPDWPPPDQVFVQKLPDTGVDWSVVILVWLEPGRSDQARLSLYQIGAQYYGFKRATTDIVQETTVRGQPAFWVEGPHPLQLQDGRYQDWLFVEGSVLLWADGNVTYRLESDLPLAEAVGLAESLVEVRR